MNTRSFYVALTLLSMTAAASAERIKIAIVPGLAVNLESARVDALGQDLADALATELDVDAIGGLEVRRSLPVDMPADCHARAACVADVGRRTGATQLLFVAMVDSTGSGVVQVDSIWVDVKTGTITPRRGIDVPATAEAKSRFQAAAKSLFPDAPVRVRPSTSTGNTVMSAEVPRHLTPATYALGAVAVVGVGVGVGFGLSARSQYNACEAVACTQDVKDHIRTRTLIADAGFVVAIGGMVAAGVLFATSGKESRLIVAPSPTGVSLAARGSF